MNKQVPSLHRVTYKEFNKLSRHITSCIARAGDLGGRGEDGVGGM